MVSRLGVDSPVRWTPAPVEEGFGIVACRIGRRRNAAPMFCYAGRRGEREGLGKRGAWEVPVAGRGSETKGIGFFFRGFWELYM